MYAMLTVGQIIGLGLMAAAIAGGLLGSYHNIRHARGPRERAFAVRMTAVVWLLATAFLAAMYLAEGHLRYYVLGGFFVLCPLLMYKWSTTHQMIRLLDERERATGAEAGKPGGGGAQ